MPVFTRVPYDTIIEINRSVKQGDLSGIMASLLTVFLKGDESLEDFVPPYWRKVIQRGFYTEQARQEMAQTMQSSMAQAKPDMAQAMRDMAQAMRDTAKGPASKRLSSPVLKYHLKPNYTEEARKIRVRGRVALRAVIDENGTAKVTDVLKPLVAGQDY